MNEIGPKYPFEPLPLPEKPSMRNVSLVKSEDVTRFDDSTTKPIEKSKSKSDFRNLLAKKEIEKISEQIIPESEKQKLIKVAQDLEAFFIYSILKNFNRTLSDSGIFPKAPGSQMYMDMFYEGVADSVSKNQGGFGLADQIAKSLETNMIQEFNRNQQQKQQ